MAEACLPTGRQALKLVSCSVFRVLEQNPQLVTRNSQHLEHMCGICGKLNFKKTDPIDPDLIRDMAAALSHRGPDELGFYNDKKIGLGHSRLSIIDLSGGQQPMHNEDKSIWIIFNGEIFNYLELREELINKGHTFYTKSDTEVIIHAYEEYGSRCVDHLNGQFAFAIWNKRHNELMLARDRMGIRPLFYTAVNNSFIFSSEIKSILLNKEVAREIDLFALDQIFTFWGAIPPRTIFKNIMELPPAHYLIIRDGRIDVKRYWDLKFPEEGEYTDLPEEYYAERLEELLIDSTRLQLRSDVPVGAYLSGGLDSSITTALIRKYTGSPLKTFSVAFEDKAYDESSYQRSLVNHLNTDHREVICKNSDIARVFPDVIWHTEKPILRTAPAPLYLLSKLVRDNGIKVVLTGEGADEVLAGYDIFKEAKIRRFWAKMPDSKFRPLLLKRLYPYLPAMQTQSKFYLEAFFKTGISEISDEFFSHLPRWETTSKIKEFFSNEIKETLKGYNPVEELRATLSRDFNKWDWLSKAQYIETANLLPGYILSSQGDRMAMANSVEGRFPFLDHRVVEFCCAIPPNFKMKVLKEKYILKKALGKHLPQDIVKRTKQPYMAPDSKSFFGNGTAPDYVEDLLSSKSIKENGYFNPQSVERLVNKCKKNLAAGFKDNMALVGILSMQLVDRQFVKRARIKLESYGLRVAG